MVGEQVPPELHLNRGKTQKAVEDTALPRAFNGLLLFTASLHTGCTGCLGVLLGKGAKFSLASNFPFAPGTGVV